jgi:hypothetical protein
MVESGPQQVLNAGRRASIRNVFEFRAVSFDISAAIMCSIEPAAGELQLVLPGSALAHKVLMVLTLSGTAGLTPNPWLK